MKHVVITRMLYKDEIRFLERLKIYKRYLLESLRHQTKKDFDIAVLCNKEHASYLSELGVIPFFLKDKNNFGTRDTTWHCKVKWEELEGLDKYDIQSNIDSDDWVSGDYIGTVKHYAQGNESVHIHFQPLLVCLKTGLVKRMNNVYNENNGSAFCSLYQPNKNNYVYIGQDGHRRMPQYADKSVIVNEGFCFVGIHDNNDSTTINA